MRTVILGVWIICIYVVTAQGLLYALEAIAIIEDPGDRDFIEGGIEWAVALYFVGAFLLLKPRYRHYLWHQRRYIQHECAMFKLRSRATLRTALYAIAGVQLGISLRAFERGNESLGFFLLVTALICIGAYWRIKDYSNNTKAEAISKMQENLRSGMGSTVTHTAAGLEIRIRPYRRQYFFVTLLLWGLFLLVAAIFGYGFISHPNHVHSDPTGLISALPLLLVCLLVITWLFLSVETIRVSTSELSYRRMLFGIGRSREFMLSDIKNLRAMPFSQTSNLVDRHGSPGLFVYIGMITFDYGHKTYRIASGIRPSEAKDLVTEITKMLPVNASK